MGPPWGAFGQITLTSCCKKQEKCQNLFCFYCGLHIRTLQEKVYKTCMTDLDDLKHCIRTEWAKLDHAIISAAVHQWRWLSACVNVGGGHFEDCIWCRHYVCSDNCDLPCCCWPVGQLHAHRLNCSCQLWLLCNTVRKVKWRHWLGDVVVVVSHYLHDVPCKKYDYILSKLCPK